MNYEQMRKEKKDDNSFSRGLTIANIIVWTLLVLEIIRNICGFNF